MQKVNWILQYEGYSEFYRMLAGKVLKTIGALIYSRLFLNEITKDKKLYSQLSGNWKDKVQESGWRLTLIEHVFIKIDATETSNLTLPHIFTSLARISETSRF